MIDIPLTYQYKAQIREAIKLGKIDDVQTLTQRVTPAEYDDFLHIACQNNKIAIAQYLIENGADVKAIDIYGSTALHFACRSGNLELVKLLIDNGADIKALNKWQITPLHHACWSGNLELAKWLIEKGADAKALDKSNNTTLHSACEYGHLELAQWLIVEHGIDVKAVGQRQNTPLHNACRSGNLELAQSLLKNGADLTATNAFGSIPLHSACEYGHLDIAKWLVVGNNIDVNIRNNHGYTTLHYACQSGNVELAQWLIVEHNIDVKVIDNYGYTTLYFACDRGHLKMAQFLLDKGADIRAINKFGNTTLHYACQSGDFKTAQWLIDNSADINAKNKDNKTPLYVACEYRHSKIIEALLSCCDEDGYLKADPAILPEGTSTLLTFFQDKTPDHEAVRQLLRGAGCKEIPPPGFESLNSEIQAFIKNRQNVHASVSSDAFDINVKIMRRNAGYNEQCVNFQHLSATPDNERRKDFLAARNELIAKHLPVFFSELDSIHKSMKERYTKEMLELNDPAKQAEVRNKIGKLEAGYKRLIDEDHTNFAIDRIGTNKSEVLALIVANTRDFPKKRFTNVKELAQAQNAVYEIILQEAAAMHQVCPVGFLGHIVQAPAQQIDGLVTPIELLNSNFALEKALAGKTNGLITLAKASQRLHDALSDIAHKQSVEENEDILQLARRIYDNKEEYEEVEGTKISQKAFDRYQTRMLAANAKSALLLRGKVKQEIVENFDHYLKENVPEYIAENDANKKSRNIFQHYVLAVIDVLIHQNVRLSLESPLGDNAAGKSLHDRLAQAQYEAYVLNNPYMDRVNRIEELYIKTKNQGFKSETISLLANLFDSQHSNISIIQEMLERLPMQLNEKESHLWNAIKDFVPHTDQDKISLGLNNKLSRGQYRYAIEELENKIQNPEEKRIESEKARHAPREAIRERRAAMREERETIRAEQRLPSKAGLGCSIS